MSFTTYSFVSTVVQAVQNTGTNIGIDSAAAGQAMIRYVMATYIDPYMLYYALAVCACLWYWGESKTPKKPTITGGFNFGRTNGKEQTWSAYRQGTQGARVQSSGQTGLAESSGSNTTESNTGSIKPTTSTENDFFKRKKEFRLRNFKDNRQEEQS